MLNSYLKYLTILLTLLQVQSSFVFEYLLNKITNKKFDIELVNGPPQYYELKNKNYAGMQTLPSSDADQVLSATGAFSKIDNIEDYEWTAYIRRFGEHADPEEAKTILKDLWKARFEAQKVEVFQIMSVELRTSILGNGNANRFDLFEQAINNLESNLYKFIKAE